MALNARTKSKAVEYVLFNVLYEDGSRTSNRKIPASEIEGVNMDRAVKAFFEAQDRKIAEASGMPRGAIKTVTRAGK